MSSEIPKRKVALRTNATRSAASRLKYDNHLLGSERDWGLKVENRWLRHSDARGVSRRPPKNRGSPV
jgi:hypothetical protein